MSGKILSCLLYFEVYYRKHNTAFTEQTLLIKAGEVL